MATLCCSTDRAGLAQSVERLTVEREVALVVGGAGPIFRGLKISEK